MKVWPQTYIPIIGEVQVSYMLESFYAPESLINQMTTLEHQFLVGCYLGEPVSFASFSKIREGIYKLHKIYILPSVQGKGIGKALLTDIVDRIRLKGGDKLELNVNIYNTNAQSFYERYGFRHLRSEDIDIGSGFFMNDHVLCYDLK
jgi:diamine N-acetyltransferase